MATQIKVSKDTLTIGSMETEAIYNREIQGNIDLVGMKNNRESNGFW